jgi:hypothetical protein
VEVRGEDRIASVVQMRQLRGGGIVRKGGDEEAHSRGIWLMEVLNEKMVPPNPLNGPRGWPMYHGVNRSNMGRLLIDTAKCHSLGISSYELGHNWREDPPRIADEYSCCLRERGHFITSRLNACLSDQKQRDMTTNCSIKYHVLMTDHRVTSTP